MPRKPRFYIAGMMNHPSEYQWPSYPGNAEGATDSLLAHHSQYLALGRSIAERQECYQELFKAHVDAKVISGIRAAWQTGTPLGNDRFREEVEGMLNRKTGQDRRGRPSRSQS